MDVILQQHLNLTINPSTTSSSSAATACDSYTWNGTTYTCIRNVILILTTNANGCDSTATLNLTINPSTISTSTSAATACDTYSWNGIYLYDGIWHSLHLWL